MIPVSARSTRRRGVATVEFAVALLWILPPLIIGVWEVGRLVEIQQILSNAAREGARQAATGQFTNSQIQSVVTNYLARAGLPTTNAQVTVSDLGTVNPSGSPSGGGAGNDVSLAVYLDQLQVTVQIPFNDVRWVLLYLATDANTNLSATASWLTAVDKSYPNTPEPPTG